MKTVKRVFAIALAVVMLCTCLFGSAVPASAASASPATTSQNAVVKIAKNSSSYGIKASDYGAQGWVARVYQKAVGTFKSAESAKAAWQNYGVSTSKTNIPVGAVVYGDTGRYGHCGIYIGNNKVVHDVGSSVKTVSLSTWQKNFNYVGWGWNGTDMVTMNVRSTSSGITSNSIKVQWNANPWATQYKLQRSTNGKSWTTVYTGTATEYKNKNLASGTNYIYRVGTNILGDGWVYEKETIPTKPSALKLTSDRGTSVRVGYTQFVRWNNAGADAKYEVQKRNGTTGSWSSVGTFVKGEYYTFKAKSAGTYQVRVRAFVTYNGTKLYTSWATISIKAR